MSAVSASGTIKPTTQVMVTAQVPGEVVAVPVDYNANVTKGDVLAQLNPEVYASKLKIAEGDLQLARGAIEISRSQVERARHEVENARSMAVSTKAELEQAQISLADAKKDLARKRELVSTGDAAPIEAERAVSAFNAATASVAAANAKGTAATAQIASASDSEQVAAEQLKNAVATIAAKEAAVTQAQLDLDHATIRAPVDGTVVERNVVVGQTVPAGGSVALFTIASDLHQVELHASVDESDIGRVTVRQPASFTFDSYPAQTFRGVVTDIRKTPQLSQGVVSYDVVIDAENPDLKLLPGMTAAVRIIAGRQDNAVKVPNAALRYHPAEKTADMPAAPNPGSNAATSLVWIVDENGKPHPKPVKSGITDGTYTEVVDGDLKAGEQVIVGEKRGGEGAPNVGPLKF